MRRLVVLGVLALVLTGCGHAKSEAPAEEPQPPQRQSAPGEADTGSELIDESNEIIEGSGSAAEKQQAVCEKMREQGSFDGTGVSPEEVGC